MRFVLALLFVAVTARADIDVVLPEPPVQPLAATSMSLPALATNGEGYLAAWVDGLSVFAATLDAEGRPKEEPSTLVYTATRIVDIAVVWNGEEYVLAMLADDALVMKPFGGAAVRIPLGVTTGTVTALWNGEVYAVQLGQSIVVLDAGFGVVDIASVGDSVLSAVDGDAFVVLQRKPEPRVLTVDARGRVANGPLLDAPQADQLAITPSGYVVAWAAPRSIHMAIYTILVGRDGAAMREPLVIGEEHRWAGFQLASAGATTVAVWRSLAGSHGARRLSPDGTPAEPASYGGGDTRHRIATAIRGDDVMLLTSGSGMYASRLGHPGSHVVPRGIPHQQFLDLAFAGEHAGVVWTEGFRRLFVTVSRDGRVSAPVSLGDWHRLESDGELFALFRQDGRTVVAQRVLPDGTFVDAEPVTVLTASELVRSLFVAPSRGGFTVVASTSMETLIADLPRAGAPSAPISTPYDGELVGAYVTDVGPALVVRREDEIDVVQRDARGVERWRRRVAERVTSHNAVIAGHGAVVLQGSWTKIILDAEGAVIGRIPTQSLVAWGGGTRFVVRDFGPQANALAAGPTTSAVAYQSGGRVHVALSWRARAVRH